MHNQTKHKQSFYADDAAACAKIDDLKQWLQQVVAAGPKYGYYPEPKKSFLIVHPDHVDEAKRCFEQTGLKNVTGKRYLGGFIGDEITMKKFVHEKIKNWQTKIQFLSTPANFCPHESFSVFTKSVQAEWNFLMRVVPGCDEFLKPLEDSIKNQFISTVTNIYTVSNPQSTLSSLSAKIGGLGIPDPLVKASEQFEMSKKTSSLICDSIWNGTTLDVDAHKTHVRSSKQSFQLENESQQSNTYKGLLDQACISERKRMEQNFKTGNSCCLTAKVSERDNFFCRTTNSRIPWR